MSDSSKKPEPNWDSGSPFIDHNRRDWPEDAIADEDNGWYMNKCIGCSEMFNGHKRRTHCKVCAPPPACVPPSASEAGEALEAVERAVAWYDRMHGEHGGSDALKALPALRRAVAESEAQSVEILRLHAMFDDDCINLNASLTAAESALTERSNEVAALKVRCEEAEREVLEERSRSDDYLEAVQNQTLANAALSARVKGLTEAVHDIGQECHMQGRVYSEGGEIDGPAEVHAKVRAYVERRIATGPAPVEPEGEADAT